MKIGFMVDAYKPHISGVTNYVALLKDEAARRGHTARVFCFGRPEWDSAEEGVVVTPGLPVYGAYYAGLRYTAAARELLAGMDVIHIQHPFLSGRLALLYTRGLNIPLVFTNHTRYDLYMRSYMPLISEKMGEALMKAYLPPFYEKMDLVVAPSAGVAEILRSWGGKYDLRVIPNGIDLQPFQHPARVIPRGELGFDAANILLVYAGRIAAEKNLDFLLRAFAMIQPGQPAARLMVIGAGPELPRLRRLAGELGMDGVVRFLGAVDYAELPGYLAAADAFVTASVSEVHPLTVIEALASGLPVVGIRSPGVADTVEHELTGLLSEHDLDQFAASLTQIISDAMLRRKMGAAACQSARSYSIEATAERLFAEYDRLITQRRERGAPA